MPSFNFFLHLQNLTKYNMVNRFFFGMFLLFTSLAVSAQKIHFSIDNGGFWIMENSQKIIFFQRDMNDSIPEYARNNYFHPLYDLNGKCITEDFPQDHLHHRGIFWAWHQILVNGKPVCDSWDIKNFTQNIDQIEFRQNKEGNGILTYSSFWHTKDKAEDPFMRENTTVTVYPRNHNYRRIDFTIQLRALEYNFSLGGSDDVKGYGGFSIRMKTNESTVFTDLNNRKITPSNEAINAGQMVDISNPKMKNGVTIISWPQNPGEVKWILRQTGSMQNCAWPGREPVGISVTQPTELKYTLLIHNGKRKNIPFDKILKNIK